jgi:hypothetical protein
MLAVRWKEANTKAEATCVGNMQAKKAGAGDGTMPWGESGYASVNYYRGNAFSHTSQDIVILRRSERRRRGRRREEGVEE